MYSYKNPEDQPPPEPPLTPAQDAEKNAKAAATEPDLPPDQVKLPAGTEPQFEWFPIPGHKHDLSRVKAVAGRGVKVWQYDGVEVTQDKPYHERSIELRPEYEPQVGVKIKPIQQPDLPIM
jgi:hypothetical protein